MKIHVSHIVLYALYLLQTAATALFCVVWWISDIVMHAFCPSVILVLPLDVEASAMPYLLTNLWFIFRVAPLLVGVFGFWHPIPRKISLGLATAFTAWEFYWALEFALATNRIAPILLTVAMLALCIKGFSDVKNEWKDSYKRLCAQRRDLPPRDDSQGQNSQDGRNGRNDYPNDGL